MQNHSQQVDGSDYFPLFATSETTAGALCPIFGDLVLKDMTDWRKLSVDHQDDQRAEAHDIQGEAESTGFVQL